MHSHHHHGEEVEVEERLEELEVGGHTAPELAAQPLEVPLPQLHELKQVREGATHLTAIDGRARETLKQLLSTELVIVAIIKMMEEENNFGNKA